MKEVTNYGSIFFRSRLMSLGWLTNGLLVSLRSLIMLMRAQMERYLLK